MESVSQESNQKDSKLKRFLLGVLYWALLIVVGFVAYLAESFVVGLILSIVLLVGYIIYPKRKGFWFWWWVFLAAVWVAYYTYLIIKFGVA